MQRIVDLLPVSAAGVALISPTTHPRFVAGSDESAIRYEHLQTTLGEGPCLASYETDGPISIPDLGVDDRFRGSRREHGPRGWWRCSPSRCVTVTVPGRARPLPDDPGALDQREMSVAQTLADVATAYLLNAQARVAKTEFVGTVSHELRTPMTSITGYVELLQDAGNLTEDQRVFVEAIRRNSDRLTSLANDLLTLSSLETGTFVHALEDVDLGAVVRAAESLGSAIAARRLAVTFEVPEPGDGPR